MKVDIANSAVASVFLAAIYTAKLLEISAIVLPSIGQLSACTKIEKCYTRKSSLVIFEVSIM